MESDHKNHPNPSESFHLNQFDGSMVYQPSDRSNGSLTNGSFNNGSSNSCSPPNNGLSSPKNGEMDSEKQRYNSQTASTKAAILSTQEEYDKCRQLYDYDEAPAHLRFNPFIRSGYRGILSTQMCLESVFWWTNETINIWSHLFGYLLFLGLTVTDLALLQIQAGWFDKLIVGALLGCFQACMILSSMYHTFSCRSEHDYRSFLAYDLFGISLSLFAIYISGIYYAFWCFPALKFFYMVTVTIFFCVAMGVQLPRFECSDAIKMLTFVIWAGYGVIPTIHWTIEMGGWENAMVKLLLPRVLGMYLISGLAFLIYLTRIPERWFSGRVDYLGHSHQWWHIFVVLALYYWHNSGLIYIDYRMHNACPGQSEIIPIARPY
ncbi:progestin and adipoQ receptor family member 3-like [Ctenocephalides felis]|uniref:progestin and adipoQ receptor family member 3-like n=1 Tax=Ctenocephalides felis TaxID=7515 RepID=UPI000E6E1063|nr:progestin and adipoQ receptor family member 3-like [Ctenocephalides felis]